MSRSSRAGHYELQPEKYPAFPALFQDPQELEPDSTGT